MGHEEHGHGGLIHYALSYDTREDYLDVVVPFLRQAAAAGEPAVAMLAPSHLELVRDAVDVVTRANVSLLDMAVVGCNPARIIPTAREFAAEHPHQRIRVIGEPIWPGQPDKQIREGIRHEACVNTLFSDIAATVLCPYDTGVGAAVLAAAAQTHPHRPGHGTYHPNPDYVDSTVTLDRWNHLSPTPSRPAITHRVRELAQLAGLRTAVRDWAEHTGLEQDRLIDLVLATDAAAGTAVAAASEATVRGWSDRHSLVCEVTDTLPRPDAFAGRLAPPAEARRGRSLWLINQVCDLVEHRSYPHGTVLRMHLNHAP